MGYSQKRQLIENYLNVYNSFDIAGMLAQLDADIEFENIADNQLTASSKGLKEFEALAQQGKSAFTSRKQTLPQITEETDKICIQVSYTGILAIDLPNGLKAGDELTLTGRSEFTFSHDKIKSIRDYS